MWQFKHHCQQFPPFHLLPAVDLCSYLLLAHVICFPWAAYEGLLCAAYSIRDVVPHADSTFDKRGIIHLNPTF